MNRLQQAMKINAAIDHLYATEDGVSEIMQFNAIYDAVLDIDELINAAESEQLDEEVELELTPAGLDAITSADLDEYPYDYAPNPRPGNVFGDPEPTTAFAGAIEDDFNEFSPSVGTFEGTMNAFINEPLDVIYHQDGSRSVQPMRAPVGERVYMEFSPTSRPRYSAAETIARVYEPCGAD